MAAEGEKFQCTGPDATEVLVVDSRDLFRPDDVAEIAQQARVERVPSRALPLAPAEVFALGNGCEHLGPEGICRRIKAVVDDVVTVWPCQHLRVREHMAAAALLKEIL